MVFVASLTGCKAETPTPTTEPVQNTVTIPKPTETVEPTENVDEIASASINIKDAEVLTKSLGTDGKWIVGVIQDITVDKEIVIDGTFYDKGDKKNAEKRKLALYAQDADKNVTERYSLTIPTLTVNSPNTVIQGGTVKGDVFVDSIGFQLTDAKIDGNLYFKTQAAMDSYKLTQGKVADFKTEVTGKTEVVAK